MVRISIFDMFSPTDYRFRVMDLAPFLSEEGFVHYKSEVEANLTDTKADRRITPRTAAKKIREAAMQVTAAEVYKMEASISHDIIAQANGIRARVSDEAKPHVHVPATSYDIVDTANSMRYADAFTKVILRDLAALEKVWIKTVRDEYDTLQIGRTHLQHAEPITYGFAMAWYVSRLGDRIVKIKKAVGELKGKFSGAVGAYNSSSLFVNDPEIFEAEILRKCGLEPAEISTQIVPPEPVTDLVHYIITAFGVIANWADDVRNLMRPEIGELGIPRGPDVSRSSTMPHKANPIGPENVKSLYKETMPRIITRYLDQISDHQRDLTNSASQRHIPEIFDTFDYAVRRATRVSRSLKTHPEYMKRNFDMSADKIIAEPLQIILSSLGHPDAHRYVGELADKSYEIGTPLIDLVREDPELQPYLQRFTEDQLGILTNPSSYLGIAPQKALAVANSWSHRLSAYGL